MGKKVFHETPYKIKEIKDSTSDNADAIGCKVFFYRKVELETHGKKQWIRLPWEDCYTTAFRWLNLARGSDRKIYSQLVSLEKVPDQKELCNCLLHPFSHRKTEDCPMEPVNDRN